MWLDVDLVFGTTSIYIKENIINVRVIVELEVPKSFFLAKCYCGQEERREEEWEKLKHGKLPKNYPFWTYDIHYFDNNIHK